MAVEGDAEWDVFFNSSEFAKAATYTPSGGAAVSCTVIIDDEVEIRDGAGQVVDTATVAHFRRDEVDAPARDATLAITGGATYMVNGILRQDVGVVVASIRENG